MSSNEAGRSSQGDKSQEGCAHKKVVDYELAETGKRTGNLICKECGTIIPQQEASHTE